jgi:DNA-binding transcriptional LysR family regulator
MLNAQWLETFVTLCETGHFTRAAAQLNMTQPGVSQHLRKLESQLKQRLIARDGKRFTLTPAGDALLAYGRRRREEESALLARLETDDADRGEVALACSGSLAMLLYPHFLELMKGAPDLVVRLWAAPQPSLLDGLLSGDYDLGITDHEPSHPRLEGHKVGTDELCLVLPGDDEAAVDFAHLQRLGFIAHPDGFAHAEELFAANYPGEFTGVDGLRIRSFINQIGQIPAPVADGIGYTILPRSGIDAYPRRDALRCLTLAHPIRHDLWLAKRRGKVLAARTKRIGELAADILGPP